jgi:ketosteroid isomerase-like protein
MPDRQVLDGFIAMVVSGKHAEAVEQFYAEDATMQENLGEIRRGRANHAANERAVLARFERVETTLVDPPFVNGDLVVLHWIFEFTRADGSKLRIQELAHQRWAGNRIAAERFYYDPAQRGLRKPA